MQETVKKQNKTEVISFRLTPDSAKKLETLTQENEMKTGALLDHMIRFYYENRGIVLRS